MYQQNSVFQKSQKLLALGLVSAFLAFFISEWLVPTQAVNVLQLHFSGEATEHVASPANGSVVTPTFGPTGTFVKSGTGAVNHNLVSAGNNGVYFTPGGQQNTNKAYYKISGTQLGTLFSTSGGEATFTMKSLQTFAARTTNSRVRVFDVYDNTQRVFTFFVQKTTTPRLILSWIVGGAPTGNPTHDYFVPVGQEDTLYGNNVSLGIRITWSGTSSSLFLNGSGTAAYTANYTPLTPSWTAASALYFGAQYDGTAGNDGFFGCTDVIDEFKVYSSNANNPVPTLSSISPTSATAGGAAFTLTANGTNFVNGAIVRWNGANRTTTFVSATQLTASITAADIATAGTKPVTVFNPTPGGGTSSAVNFTVNASNPVPTLSSISPSSATAGGAAFTLTATGTNFINGSVVRWNGANRTTTFVSATQLTASITAADIAVAGTFPVTIFNPTPGGGTSTAVNFTVNAPSNPVPTLTSISPSSATAGGVAFTLTATGTNFINGSIVRWNGANRTTTFVSATQLTASITAADIATAGTVPVTIFNPTPGGGTSAAVNFTINAGSGLTLNLHFNGEATEHIASPTNGSTVTPTVGPAGTFVQSGTGAVNHAAATVGNGVYFTPGGQQNTNKAYYKISGTQTGTLFSMSGGEMTFTLKSLQTFAARTANSHVSVFDVYGNSQRVFTFYVQKTTDPRLILSWIVGGPPTGNPTHDYFVPIGQEDTLYGNNVSLGIRVTWSGTSSSLYLNGSGTAAYTANYTPLTTSWTAASALYFGAQYDGTAGNDGFFGCTDVIDEFKVYSSGGASNPVPTLSSISPSSATAGGAAFTLTATGTNFINGSVVRWNGANRTTTFVSATQLTANITAADIAAVGTFPVTVFNPTPGGGTSSAVNFTITNSGATLNLALTVKEAAGVGATDYPVTAVAPLPYGQYQNINTFRIVDSGGVTVPAQFEVLNRWWGRDNSIRHVMVHFQPSVVAYQGTVGSGTATYTLKNDGTGNASSTSLSVSPTTQNAASYTIITGPLKITVNKASFNIIDGAWLDLNNDGIFAAAEQLITPNINNGGQFIRSLANNGSETQLDSSRTDVQLTVEEFGPMRVVIKAEAIARYASDTSTVSEHTHGYAARIYAYKGKSFVKVDYQLQNAPLPNNTGTIPTTSELNTYGGPLYFTKQALDYRLNYATGTTNVRFGLGSGTTSATRATGGGAYLSQESHNSWKSYDTATGTVIDQSPLSNGFQGGAYYVDVANSASGVTGMIRNFWEMWPNRLEVDSQNKLSLQLFPQGASRVYRNTSQNNTDGPVGLHWLDDQQSCYKETLLYFHGPSVSNVDLEKLSKTFQYQPVAVVPVSWYATTQATLDLSGVIPITQKVSAATDARKPIYVSSDFDKNNATYQFGWSNFSQPDGARKMNASAQGGQPHTAAAFIATEDASEYFNAERFAIGELNVRPEWVKGYTYATDFSVHKLTENPYPDRNDPPAAPLFYRWRKFFSNNILKVDPASVTANGSATGYRSGTGHDGNPRDDAHGWFYHVEEAYYFTGNPWIKDWYQGVREFRLARLNQQDPFPDLQARAVGHSLAHVLQAYRVTGSLSLKVPMRGYLLNFLAPVAPDPDGGQTNCGPRGEDCGRQNALYGGINREWASGYGFGVGYLSRALIGYYDEFKGQDPQAEAEAFNLISGFMEWNRRYGNFTYSSLFNVPGLPLGVPPPGISESAGDTGFHIADAQAWYYWNTGKGQYLTQVAQFNDVGIGTGGTASTLNLRDWTKDKVGNPRDFLLTGMDGRYTHFALGTTRADITPPATISNLSVTDNGTSATLTWTAPTDAVRYHTVWSTKPIVAETAAPDGANAYWWAANAVRTNLVALPGQSQSLSVSGIPSTGAVWFAMFSFDQSNNLSSMSNVYRIR